MNALLQDSNEEELEAQEENHFYWTINQFYELIETYGIEFLNKELIHYKYNFQVKKLNDLSC